MISIILNPFAFALCARLQPMLDGAARGGSAACRRGHRVLVGYGRVGSLVAAALERSGTPFVVIEGDAERIRELRERGIPFVEGNAASREILGAAHPEDGDDARDRDPERVRGRPHREEGARANPGLTIVARAHSDAEVRHLRELGANTVIMGERQIALEMIAEIERLRSAATS